MPELECNPCTILQKLWERPQQGEAQSSLGDHSGLSLSDKEPAPSLSCEGGVGACLGHHCAPRSTIGAAIGYAVSHVFISESSSPPVLRELDAKEEESIMFCLHCVHHLMDLS